MKTVNVALLQILNEESQSLNLEKGMNACRKAKEMGADIALFPEMWNNGYNIPQNITELKSQSVSADSEFVLSFGKLAKELNMAVGITFLETFDPLPRNTLALFDRKGALVLKYSKVHTCDFGYEKVLTPGEDFYVADLDTEKGMVKVGAMICYDREFPESARILMLKGAEIALVPNSCPMEINRLTQLRGRAFENMMGIATCNYPDGHDGCNGHSTAFDGVAYLPDLPESRDMCILEAGIEEGVYIAKFDIDMMREYRREEVHGNAYRRPKKYHILIDETISEPFIRDDYRK